MSTGGIIGIIVAVLAVCCCVTHRRVIKALIQHKLMPKAPDWHVWVMPGTMEHARAKVDAGIEFMRELGIEYYCFHDVDLVPEDPEDINVTNARLDEISDYILKKTKGTSIKCH